RYPVKSMAGEQIQRATLTDLGVPGDRLVWVRGPEGVRTARRQYQLLGLRGTLSPEGEVLVNGHPWDSPVAAELVRAAAGEDAWLERAPTGYQFDILPLLVATDGAVAAFGRDIRRLRPNLLISGVDGMDETTWEGAELIIGDAIIELDSLRGRCPMTTVDPDTITRDPAVLKDIGRRFGGRLALNAAVGRGGEIAVGNPVTLHRAR
ncbi:MAG TPA: MOSC domain-containing protein, partial [Gemmatimonadales bacterium]|nr:MOSC domain-containing protein [Gemmatimonadales bacterium]